MKNQILEWSEIAMSSLNLFWSTIAEQLPAILGAIIILIIGWFIARIIASIVRKIISSINLEKVNGMINDSELIKNAEIKIDPVKIISKFVYWLVLIFFFVVSADTLGWTVVSEEIGSLFRYLPKLLVAIIIFVVGWYIATFVRQFLSASFKSMTFGGGNLVSSIAYYILLIIVGVMALDQAGISTDIVSSNLNIILGAILFAFAIGFGLASKDIIRKMLFSFYSNSTYEEGQMVQLDGIKGEIVSITNMSVVIKTPEGHEIIPMNDFMDSRVQIINK